jgi:hypothetical protein
MLYLLNSSIKNKVKFQITTNGIVINEDVYAKIIKKLDIVNLSYNEIYFKKNNLFQKISRVILDKNKININFIYDPNIPLIDIKRNFLLVIKE